MTRIVGIAGNDNLQFEQFFWRVRTRLSCRLVACFVGSLVGALLASSSALAAISPGSISVSSYANPETDGVTSTTLYAGYADSGSKCTVGDGISPCDSCSGLSITVCDSLPQGIACNKSNVYGSLPLTISFAVNDAAKIKTGTSLIKASKDSTSLDGFIETSGTTLATGMAVNTVLTARILWSSIFSKFGTLSSDGLGTASFKASFKIGVALDGASLTSTDEQFTVNINYRYIPAITGASADPASAHTICPASVPGGSDAASGEGICGFSIKAGDSKVYVQDVYLPKATWPSPADFSAAGVPFTAARFFYAQNDATSSKFCAINLSTAGTADLAVNSDFSLPVSKIFNLQNDKQYVFLVSTVDKAGNVTRFSSQTYLDGETVFKHSATPSQVAGLLDGKKCFIATAAFGSEMAPQVEWIRQFRNHFLLPHGWGRSFIRWYYANSPPLAEYISQHETLRVFVRAALWPVVIISSLAVRIGFWPTALGLVLLLFVLGFGLGFGFHFFMRRVRRNFFTRPL